MAGYGIAAPRGVVIADPAEARAAAAAIGPRVVLKAQVHAGGRGKGGGIRLAADPDEAERIARLMLGMTLVTAQTGSAGRIVHRILVEEAAPAAREFYLGAAVDRARAAVVIMASTEGGVEIETTAAETPSRIDREYVHPAVGLCPFQARALVQRWGLSGEPLRTAARIILDLHRAFEETDASLAEINPLALTADGRWLALDAKMEFDDNALPRRPEIAALRDASEDSPLEVEAAAAGLSYIKLDGDIGCLVNGAGLAMATMDIILLHGGKPANFLDVGGGVSEDGVSAAFRILACDPGVKGALVNIFGGIVRCDLVARGIVHAASGLGRTIPVVVRMEGTNAAEGKAILAASGLPFIAAEGMKDAAEKIAALAGRDRGGGR